MAKWVETLADKPDKFEFDTLSPHEGRRKHIVFHHLDYFSHCLVIYDPNFCCFFGFLNALSDSTLAYI